VIAPDAVHGPCKADTDCPDDSPCTKGVCNANGFCDKSPRDLPFGDNRCDDQNPCTDEVCQNGACAHQPSSVPPDDGNECTDDVCMNGAAQHTPVMDGKKCGAGGNITCQGGKCACKMASECGVTTECQKYDCVDGACTSMTVGKGTAVTDKAKGDCLKEVCDGAGKVVSVPDQTDAPDDPVTGNCKKKGCDDQGSPIDIDDPTDVPPDDKNVCTSEGCNGGMPYTNMPVMDGTGCGGMAACGPAVGGGYETQPADACSMGKCATPAKVSCGLFKCDPSSPKCLATCQADGDCIAGAHCDLAMNACVPVAGLGKPCGQASDCGSGFCKDGVCCNTACDGLCQTCNDPGSKGICIAIPSGADPDNECAGTDACNGLGACAKQQAAMCSLDADCLSGLCQDGVCCNADCAGACNRCDLPGMVGQCGYVPSGMSVSGCTGSKACDGNGGCKTTNGQSCGSDGECLSTFCQDGVCCNNACSGVCAVCNLGGTVGTCTNVPQGGQPGGCNGTKACDGMNGCKKVNGQACSQASDCASGFCPDEGADQKYCCDKACSGTCQSCRADKTGLATNGICGFIKAKTDPDMECSGCNMASGHGCCDGMGACMP
jgi:hypothetical protein